MIAINRDAAATAKMLVHDLGGSAYIRALRTSVTYSRSGNHQAAHFWLEVADFIGPKDQAAAATPRGQQASPLA
jgi:hypothetical protein